jgi:uncharacterized protein YwlG (UPF0340 family)
MGANNSGDVENAAIYVPKERKKERKVQILSVKTSRRAGGATQASVPLDFLKTKIEENTNIPKRAQIRSTVLKIFLNPE